MHKNPYIRPRTEQDTCFIPAHFVAESLHIGGGSGETDPGDLEDGNLANRKSEPLPHPIWD